MPIQAINGSPAEFFCGAHVLKNGVQKLLVEVVFASTRRPERHLRDAVAK
jgi:hypothetical protein